MATSSSSCSPECCPRGDSHGQDLVTSELQQSEYDILFLFL